MKWHVCLAAVPLLLTACGADAPSSGLMPFDGGSGDGTDSGAGNGSDVGASRTDAGSHPGRDGGSTDAGMPDDTGTSHPPLDAGGMGGPCVATVARGGENTDALCSNGLDDDCNGYIDCNDYRCSRNSAVSVCSGMNPDAGMTPDGGMTSDVPVTATTITANGGSLDRMSFAAFGDVRPMNYNDTAGYPVAIVTMVMSGIASMNPPFAIGTGDYMFATNAGAVSAQLGMYLSAERMFSGYVFHAAGNHECTGTVNVICPSETSSPEAQGFRSRLQPDFPHIYHDFVVHTGLGDAHFILTAPNFWDAAQEAWFNAALDAPGMRYTIVVAHEPPNAIGPPSSSPIIEAAIAARPGRVSLRLYGHTHEFRTVTPNGVVTGNAGAPLAMGATYHGFVMVQQQGDGNLQITEYEVGSAAPTAVCSFIVSPAGALVGATPRCPR